MLRRKSRGLVARVAGMVFAVGAWAAAAGPAALSVGLDFTRSASLESQSLSLANYSNFRLGFDLPRSRLELEAGYYFRNDTRDGTGSTNAERNRDWFHSARAGMGAYGIFPLAIGQAYSGPKFQYNKMVGISRQGDTRQLDKLDLYAVSALLGFEREIASRLTVSAELMATYGLGFETQEGLGEYEEMDHIAATTASIVFRWQMR